MKNIATVILAKAEYFVMFCLIICKGGGESRVFDEEDRYTHIHEHTHTTCMHARTPACPHARTHSCVHKNTCTCAGRERGGCGKGEGRIMYKYVLGVLMD